MFLSRFPSVPFSSLYPHRSCPGHRSPTTYNCGSINSTITGKNLVLQKPQPKRSNTHYLMTPRSLPMSPPNFILKTLPDLGISSAILTVPSQFRITRPPCIHLDTVGITCHWLPTTEKAHLTRTGHNRTVRPHLTYLMDLPPPLPGVTRDSHPTRPHTLLLVSMLFFRIKMLSFSSLPGKPLIF